MHKFMGVWITNGEFASRKPRNVFHRQLEKIDLPLDELQNRHLLFRKKFTVQKMKNGATMYVTADDYYKLYINGVFVSQGPAPSYHFHYNYNVIDVTPYLKEGENVIAFHTYYQGLINRVWQSGDFRHGLLCDVVVDGETVAKSDESFLVRTHSGYSVTGISGYETQYMERYDSRSLEVGFYLPDFDDSSWEHASERRFVDYTLREQKTKTLVFEKIFPVCVEKKDNVLRVDFGKTFVGSLSAVARGENGETVKLRFGAELNADGSVRHAMRCNCDYQEEWILSGGRDELIQYDYKPFRYAEIEVATAEISGIYLLARHYPFERKVNLRPEFQGNDCAEKIWELCVHTLKYGVQETIQDCMDREKGFYLGDGCYSSLSHYILTGDDSMVRKLIDDAFLSSVISPSLMTCIDCSFMQEIAEFPLILIDLLLWHYRLSGDKEYLRENYYKAKSVVEAYRAQYEKDGLLRNVDRWCVVEWPPNYQDGYAVNILEGQVCEEPHVSLCAYYLNAVKTLNKIAEIIGESPYREANSLEKSFIDAFYDKESRLFCDGTEHRHISLIGNCFPYAFSIIPDEKFEEEFLSLLDKKGYEATSFFTSFPLLCAFARQGNWKRIKEFILHEGTWSRMLKEGATTVFEGWGKETKWNTSLFHLTFTDAVVFLADIAVDKLFE